MDIYEHTADAFQQADAITPDEERYEAARALAGEPPAVVDPEPEDEWVRIPRNKQYEDYAYQRRNGGYLPDYDDEDEDEWQPYRTRTRPE